MTIDEYAHIPAGAAYWRYGEWSIYNLNPPLLRLWSAWPVFLLGADVPDPLPFAGQAPRDRYWNYADEFTAANQSNYHRMIVAARLPMIALSCAGVVLVFFVARYLYGHAAGLASATLCTFCPNLIAHGSLVTTDAGAAIFTLLAVWTWIGFCGAPTPRNCGLAGAALACALLCKFSTIILIPLLALIGAWQIAIEGTRWRSIIAGFVTVMLIALLGINLVYGYQGSFDPLGRYEFDSTAMQKIQSMLPRWTPVPLPRDMIEGFDAVKWEIEQPFQGFLLGKAYVGTKPGYYPVAFAAKTPLATIVVLALMLLTMLYRPTRLKLTSRETPLVIALLALAAGITIGATVNIGIRYLLPILPIAFVLAGRIFAHTHALTSLLRGARRTAVVLMGLAIVESLSVAPRFLTFFNIAAGGPIGGQRILTDSNCDWGQGLIELREWMNERQVDRVLLAYFGRIDPSIYGINYEALDHPGGDRYMVVSSFYQTGLTYRARTPRGAVIMRLPRSLIDALRDTTPAAIVGNIMYVYEQRAVVEALRRGEGSIQSPPP